MAFVECKCGRLAVHITELKAIGKTLAQCRECYLVGVEALADALAMTAEELDEEEAGHG